MRDRLRERESDWLTFRADVVAGEIPVCRNSNSVIVSSVVVGWSITVTVTVVVCCHITEGVIIPRAGSEVDHLLRQIPAELVAHERKVSAQCSEEPELRWQFIGELIVVYVDVVLETVPIANLPEFRRQGSLHRCHGARNKRKDEGTDRRTKSERRQRWRSDCAEKVCDARTVNRLLCRSKPYSKSVSFPSCVGSELVSKLVPNLSVFFIMFCGREEHNWKESV